MLQLREGRQGSELLREHGIDITGRMLQTALDSGERRAIAQNKCRPCHAAAGFLGQKDKRPRPGYARRRLCSCVRRVASSDQSRSQRTARVVAARRADCKRTLSLCPGDDGLATLFRSGGVEILSEEPRQDLEASLRLQLSSSCRDLPQPHELRETLQHWRAACPLLPAQCGRHPRAEVFLEVTTRDSESLTSTLLEVHSCIQPTCLVLGFCIGVTQD